MVNANANEITVSGELDSNTVTSKKTLYIGGKHKSKIYHNEAYFKTQHSYIKSNGKTTKYRALFDYEQLSKKFDSPNKFSAIYIRHKNDKYRNSEYQNYSIISVGNGECINNNFCGEFFIGKRFNANKDIYIIRPAIIHKVKYKEYNLTINNSYIRGSHYRLLKNKIKISYDLNKKIAIKYIFDIERSKYNNLENKDKSNTLALSFKF
jgi:hypothetical protein